MWSRRSDRALTVVIPAHNEAGSIRETVEAIAEALERAEIEYEILVVDDASSDDTAAVVRALAAENPRVRYHLSHNPRGFGYAVRAGLDVFEGDAVAIVMADGSDDPEDLVRYHRSSRRATTARSGRGSSAARRSTTTRSSSSRSTASSTAGIRVLFRSGYNDTTNAFKAYRREVIETVQPLLSNHFNLTVEIPLKAIVRGHSYKVIPISWRNRKEGESKLSLQEMGSRYAFIVLYVLLERHLSRGDYRRRRQPRRRRAAARARPKARRRGGDVDGAGRRRLRGRRDAVRARLPRSRRRSGKAATRWTRARSSHMRRGCSTARCRTVTS